MMDVTCVKSHRLYFIGKYPQIVLSLFQSECVRETQANRQTDTDRGRDLCTIAGHRGSAHLWFRVEDLGFGIQGEGIGWEGLGFRVQMGFRIQTWGSGCRPEV